MVALLIDLLRALGFTAEDVKIRVNSRAVWDRYVKDLGGDESTLATLLPLIDKFAFAPGDAQPGFVEEGLRTLDHPAINAESIRAFAAEPGTPPEDVAAVISALEARGLGQFVEFDPTIVRGLAYYTGFVFEAFAISRASRAIAGGGRYDDLVAKLSDGSADLPALGFGMGDVVLGELLKERGLAPAPAASIDCFLAAIGEGDHPHLLGLARQLRDAGWRVEYALSHQNLGKQMKLADARGVRLVVVMGEDERARGAVVLKDLGERTQREVPLADLPDALTAVLGPAPAAHRASFTAHHPGTHG